MKITIYELINMAKNELPKRIKIENDIFIYDNKENDYIYEDGNISLFTDYIPNIYHLEDLKEALNQQVEILEEEKKIPEKIDIHEDEEGHYFIDKHCKKIYITYDEINFMVEEFNQLIDYLKSKGE